MTAPERIWMTSPDSEGEVEVWFDPDDGGHEYILHTRAALAGSEIVREMVAEAVKAEREACAKLADEYAEENFRMATDTIMIDQILTAHRKKRPYIRTAQTDELSEKCQIDGAMHSSSAHTAQHVAAAIRRRG